MVFSDSAALNAYLNTTPHANVTFAANAKDFTLDAQYIINNGQTGKDK